MAPQALPYLCLHPSIRRLARAPAWPAHRAHPNLRPRFHFPHPLIPGHGRSSPRAGIGGSPVWRMAAERSGGKNSGVEIFRKDSLLDDMDGYLKCMSLELTCYG
ncbi:hypothetical protein ZWY2020_037286 [Hordeum vulgare]|nr:hypothetical protein ZWY2020_037286 [Hordeum vulgare]